MISLDMFHKSYLLGTGARTPQSSPGLHVPHELRDGLLCAACEQRRLGLKVTTEPCLPTDSKTDHRTSRGPVDDTPQSFELGTLSLTLQGLQRA